MVSGEARVYAQHPHFGEIDVADGSDLTTPPGARRLEVETETLAVDASSRIDMAGHGAPDGPGDDVLDVTAGTLRLDGLLTANGEDANDRVAVYATAGEVRAAANGKRR